VKYPLSSSCGGASNRIFDGRLHLDLWDTNVDEQRVVDL
jgi:hypothetical protein